jgi:hypothetical protein
MRFTGDPSGVSLPGGIVDTGSSYSVSAWVKLDDTTAPRTVVSIAGTDHALFTMGYSPSAGRWSVEMTSAAGPTYTTGAAVSDAAPTLGVWTHLTGVYIASFRELHFYVNGAKQVSQRNNIGTWAATGPLTIGRTASATASNPMAGAVSDVQVWNRQVTGPEIAKLFDPLLVGRVGEWHMDEVGPGPAFDFSGLAHDLSFLGGASIPPVAGGHAGTALWLNGHPQTAATDGPVVHTDQSFTVSAWVKMTDADPSTPAPDLPTDNRAVLSQNGTYVGGFYLGYKVIAGSPRWVFGMKNVDSDCGPWSEAISGSALTTADIGRWVHIVGVYDATNATLKLSVGGALAGTAARTGRWDAAGEFLIGSARFTSPDATPQQTNWWVGHIDEVRVYAGAVADVTRIP